MATATGHRLLTILALLFSSGSSTPSMQRSQSITSCAGGGTRWKLVETVAKAQKTEDEEAIPTMLPANPCPCEEEWMCRPLSPQPGLREEVVAFPAGGDHPYPYEQHQSGIYGTNGSEWHLFNWSKITSIVPFTNMDMNFDRDGRVAMDNPDMFCTAHKNNVRVLSWGNGIPDPPENTPPGRAACPVGVFYNWALQKDTRMFDANAVTEWAVNVSTCLAAAGYDGVSLDMEGTGDCCDKSCGPVPMTPGWTPTCNQTIRNAVADAVCTLKTELTKAVPGSLLTWTVGPANMNNHSYMIENECIDIFLVMDYCWCVGYEHGWYNILTGTDGPSMVRNRAPMGLPFVNYTIEFFNTMGVPPSRLGIIAPWFGCDFQCLAADTKEGNFNGCAEVELNSSKLRPVIPWMRDNPKSKPVDHPNDVCGVGADAGLGEELMFEYIWGNATGFYYNKSLETPYFNWVDMHGVEHQNWFDTSASMSLKYNFAKAAGVRAVGMWVPGAVRLNHSLAKSMWNSVPDPDKLVPPAPAPKPGQKYSCWTPPCERNRCYSTCIEDLGGNYSTINCNGSCKAEPPPPPAPPGPAPPPPAPSPPPAPGPVPWAASFKCPCDAEWLCRPLSPQPPADQQEVIAFPGGGGNGPEPDGTVHLHRESGMYGSNGSEWRNYDWSKITAIAPFVQMDRGDFPDMYCHAHANGVRMLSWDGGKGRGSSPLVAPGGGCPVSQFYQWSLADDPRMYDREEVKSWAVNTSACIVASGYDGILLDAEGSGSTTNQTKRAAITAAVCELRAELRKALPGALLAWTVDTGGYFEYSKMTEDNCVDLWLAMEYCWCVGWASAVTSLTRNRAPAPLPFLNFTLSTFKDVYGVPASKLGFVLPWFGCDFTCDETSSGKGFPYFHGCRVWHDGKQFPIIPGADHANGDACGADADAGPGIGLTYEFLVPNMTTAEPYYNKSLDTSYFNWRNGSGDLHQVWYDGPDSMKLKYNWAIDHGLRGVGMWTSDATLHNESLTKAMWAAVPDPNKIVPPPPPPKKGMKYSCYNASCSASRCFSTCVENPLGGRFTDINCEHRCIPHRPPPPPPPGPHPPPWTGPPPPPTMQPPGGTYFLNVNMSCFHPGSTVADCGPGAVADHRDVQARLKSIFSLHIWTHNGGLNATMIEVDDDVQFVSAWPLEQVIMRTDQANTTSLDFVRVVQQYGYAEYYRTTIVEGILRGRFAVVSKGLPSSNDFHHPVTGWNPAVVDNDIVPRQWDVTLLCYGKWRLRIDRDQTGRIVGRLKNESTAGSSQCSFGQTNCTSPEGIEIDVNISHWDGESIAWSAVLFDPVRYPPSPPPARSYCGDGVTVCHFYATERSMRGATPMQSNFFKGNIWPIEPHNGCSWDGVRRAILAPGFLGFDNCAARNAWQAVTTKRLEHLMMAGNPQPVATPEVHSVVVHRNSTCAGLARDDACQTQSVVYDTTELNLTNYVPNLYNPKGQVTRMSHGYLAVPRLKTKKKMPAAVVLNGLHGSAFDTLWPNTSYSDGRPHDPKENPASHGSAAFWYGDSLARRGFVVLALDIGHRSESSLYDGKLAGYGIPGEHLQHGIIYPGQNRSTGVFDWEEDGERAWDVSRAIDYLLHLPQVDPHQLVVTGLGMGAEVATTAAAFDSRIRMVVPAGWCPDLASDLSLKHAGNPDGSRSWRWQNAFVEDYIDVNTWHSLIAPRPLIVETGKQDMEHSLRPIAPWASAKQVMRRTRAAYGADAAANLVHYMHEEGHAWQTGVDSGLVKVPVVTGPRKPGDTSWQTDSATQNHEPAGNLFDLMHRMMGL